jgi:hypothetical protein
MTAYEVMRKYTFQDGVVVTTRSGLYDTDGAAREAAKLEGKAIQCLTQERTIDNVSVWTEIVGGVLGITKIEIETRSVNVGVLKVVQPSILG